MGARNTTPVKDGQKFTLKTEAKVVSESTVGAGERKKVLAFLETAAFKKRILADLNSNFVHDKRIKIFVDEIRTTSNLKVTLKGHISVLKTESEPEYLVKDGLETALPHYSAAGESMPPRQPFQIRFMDSDTSVEFAA